MQTKYKNVVLSPTPETDWGFIPAIQIKKKVVKSSGMRPSRLYS